MIGRSHILPWELCRCRQCRGRDKKNHHVRKAKRAEEALWRKEHREQFPRYVRLTPPGQ